MRDAAHGCDLLVHLAVVGVRDAQQHGIERTGGLPHVDHVHHEVVEETALPERRRDALALADRVVDLLQLARAVDEEALAAGLVGQLAGEVRLPVSEPAGHRRSPPGRRFRVDAVHVEGEVESRRAPCHALQRLVEARGLLD